MVNLDAWRYIEAPQTVIDWLEKGISIPFHTKPYCFEKHNHKLSFSQTLFVRSEIYRLLKAGYIQQLDYKPRYISPIGCVPKKTGGYRLITDFRQLNAFCNSCTFKQEDIRNVEKVVEQKDFFTSIDLKDGFYHIPINCDNREYLSFQFEGKYFSYVVLPFGFSLSPYFFTKVLRPVVKYLRSQGVRLSLYVDDFLICASASVITDHTDLVIHTLNDLGLKINLEKSVLRPCQIIDYLGYTIDATGEYVSIKAQKARVVRIKRQIKAVINKGRASARVLAKTAGLCVSVAWVVAHGKLFLRHIYRLLATRQSWDSDLILNSLCINELSWWLEAIDEWNCKLVKPQPIDIQLETDASHTGWGARIGHLEAKGDWNTRLAWKSSNYRELLAILLALISFKTVIRGKCVQILTDNVTAMAYINHRGGPSAELTQLAIAVWGTAIDCGVSLVCNHIAGIDNTTADTLSRQPDPHNWMLHPKLFHMLDVMWGPHTVDRFATFLNAQLPTFNSRYWEPMSAGVDALAQDWSEENNFINPPWALLPKIIEKVIADRAVATIIAPIWPSQPWFHKLASLLIKDPFYLPRHPKTFIPMGVKAEPIKNPMWQIAAWRVYGRNV